MILLKSLADSREGQICSSTDGKGEGSINGILGYMPVIFEVKSGYVAAISIIGLEVAILIS